MATDGIFKKTEVVFSDAMILLSIVQIIIFTVLVKGKGGELWIWSVDTDKNIHTVRFLLIVQALSCGVIMAFHFISISMIHIGDATTIYFSNFLPTMILSKIFLKEKIGIFKILFGLMGMVGLILVVKSSTLNIHGKQDGKQYGILNSTNNNSFPHPKTEDSYNFKHDWQNYLFGTLLCTVGMLISSINQVITAVLYQNESTNCYMQMLYDGVGKLLVSLIFTIIGGHQRLFLPSSLEKSYVLWNWISMFIMASTAISMRFCNVGVLRFIGPITTSFIQTFDIVLGYLTQIIFFDVVPNFLSLLGAFCILLMSVIVPFEKIFVSFIPEKLQPFF